MSDSPREVAGNGSPAHDDMAAVSIDDIKAASAHERGHSADTLTGKTIAQYLVGERLGGGAMAAVYRAHDQTLDHAVAIKVVLPGADAVMQARFRREARLVSTLIHPHIVRTLQVGRSGGIIYIAMELVEGASLGDLLEQHGKLAVQDAARILAPIAEALAYAHEKGVVHRDVKPSNILLQRAERGAAHSIMTGLLPYPVIPLLSDFGIARALDAPELTNAGRTIGTPAFMAPEQCAGSSEIDGRADVYALGAVLYRCLVGRAPFAVTTTQILHAHVYDPLLIPDEVANALPPSVVRLLARSMMKEPAQRYPRIGLMANELAAIAELPRTAASITPHAEADPTMTMASLPVAQSPTATTSRVLVPAAHGGSAASVARTSPLMPPPRHLPNAPAPARVMPAPRSRTRRNRWGMIALVSAFAVLVALAAGMLVNSVLPGLGDDSPPVVQATATPAAVAVAGTPGLPAVAPAVSPTTADASPQTTAPSQNSRPAAATTRAAPAGTETARPEPTPQPPLRFVAPTWDLALASFDDRDWEQTVVHLTLVQRSLEYSTEKLPDEDVVDQAQLTQMLITSYTGLATDAAAGGNWEVAIENLEKAIELAPNEPTFASMVEDMQKLAGVGDEGGADAQAQFQALLEDVAGQHDTYANRLARGGNVCDAVIHVGYAIRLAETEELLEHQAQLDAACRELNAGDAVAKVGGTLLYSTGGGGGAYNIWSMPVTESTSTSGTSTSGTSTSGTSTLVVPNAAQPRVSPNRGILAYYSRQSGQDGLYGIHLNTALVAYGGAEHYSPNPEDSRDSPPSWDPTGTQVAYSTAFGNSWPHIMVTSASADTGTRDLGFGKDPAWSPLGDLIVFNGPDTAGANPGLWAMSSSNGGNDRWMLTGNGNDQRPVWTSDGKYVVFMSKDRSGGSSWEIYRMDWKSNDIVLLTDGNSAQDGLPAISPDDKWVVFMSDRFNKWQLFYVSIDGGEVHFLSDISGQPILWLEHAIQWVP